MVAIEQRRSARVLLDVPIVVRGESLDQSAFREETFTVTVNAHGALLMLANKVALGQKVVLTNPSLVECEGKVSYLGAFYAGLAKVAVEFNRPAPEFWPVNPVPQDWHF